VRASLAYAGVFSKKKGDVAPHHITTPPTPAKFMKGWANSKQIFHLKKKKRERFSNSRGKESETPPGANPRKTS